jgi:hypothetical protein
MRRGQGLPFLSPRPFLRQRRSASAALGTGFTKPNTFSRVVNAVRIDLDRITFAAWEHRDFVRSATTVATGSLDRKLTRRVVAAVTTLPITNLSIAKE